MRNAGGKTFLLQTGVDLSQEKRAEFNRIINELEENYETLKSTIKEAKITPTPDASAGAPAPYSAVDLLDAITTGIGNALQHMNISNSV
jgi:hypothetical protein